MEKEQQVKSGIGGWLILVAISLVLSPILLFADLMVYLTDSSVIESLKESFVSGSEYYNPKWGGYTLFIFLIQILEIIAWLCLGYLFFKKKKSFPKLYIYMMIFIVVYAFFIFGIAKFLFSEGDVEGINFLKELLVPLAWARYMEVSKRVKATFVNE